MNTTPTSTDRADSAAPAVAASPLRLDVSFLENTDAANTLLIASTDDGCGSSCPNSCTTSGS